MSNFFFYYEIKHTILWEKLVRIVCPYLCLHYRASVFSQLAGTCVCHVADFACILFWCYPDTYLPGILLTVPCSVGDSGEVCLVCTNPFCVFYE